MLIKKFNGKVIFNNKSMVKSIFQLTEKNIYTVLKFAAVP